jgi:hypothetical protein
MMNMMKTMVMLGMLAGGTLAQADELDEALQARQERVGRERPAKAAQNWLARLKQESPEEFERLMSLQEENPQQFRQEIGKMMKERWRKGHAGALRQEEKEFRELAQKYREADSIAEKQELEKKLDEKIRASFDDKMQKRLESLEQMEQKLLRLRKAVEERQANRDKICQARLEELLRDPKLRWNAGWRD